MVTIKDMIPEIMYAKYGDLCSRYINEKIWAILVYIEKTLENKVHVRRPGLDQRYIRMYGNKDYSIFKDHTYAMACDFDVEGMDSLAVQRWITKDPIASMMLRGYGLTGIEDGTSWVHITVANLAGWNMPEINGIKLIPIPKG